MSGDGRRRALILTVNDLEGRTHYRADVAVYERPRDPKELRQLLAGVIRAARNTGMTDAGECEALLVAIGELPPPRRLSFLKVVGG